MWTAVLQDLCCLASCHFAPASLAALAPAWRAGLCQASSTKALVCCHERSRPAMFKNVALHCMPAASLVFHEHSQHFIASSAV